MSNSKISALTSATTPLAGTETLPVVQSSTTKQVSVANLTAGRAVSALSVTTTSDVTVSGAATANVYAYNPTAASGGVPQSSPRVAFYGSEWNSGSGAVSMSGYWQLQALTNNVASPTSKVSLYLAGNGGTPAEVFYFGSDGNSVGYGSVTYTVAGGGNVTLENTTAATSAVPQPSGKLIFSSRSWNSANGNTGQTSYIRAITRTNNANPTIEAVAIAPSNGSGSQNEYFIFDGKGNYTMPNGSQSVTSGAFNNVGSAQTITISDYNGGYVVITSVQGGVGSSTWTIPFVKRAGSIAIGTASKSILTADPILSVTTSSGNISVTPLAANTYLTYAIYYTPLGA